MIKYNLKELVKNQFQTKLALKIYKKRANDSLWDSEKYFISKYFSNKKAKILDVGCGSGRTTIPLHKMGYKVIGIDFAEKMIKLAKDIAKKRRLKIEYRLEDATNLKLKKNTFDYVLFSNQGWTMIPYKKERLKALREIRRVLKNGGIFIFSTHQRKIFSNRILFWIKNWLKIKTLKIFRIKTEEADFGDIFFSLNYVGKKEYEKQFIHIPSIKEVKNNLKECKFKIIEIDCNKQISKKDIRKQPPAFYVVKK